MITLENRFFPLRNLLSFFVEGGIIFGAVLLSFFLLTRWDMVAGLSLADAVYRGMFVAFVCQLCMYYLDLYDLRSKQSFMELFFSVVFAVGFVCIAIGIISMIYPPLGVSGSIYLLSILLIAILLCIWRISFSLVNELLPKMGILLIGNGLLLESVAREISDRERLGFHIVGKIDYKFPEKDGNVLEIGEFVDRQNGRIDQVVVAFSERRGKYPVDELVTLKVRGYNIIEWQNFIEKLSGRIPVRDLSPSYIIFNPGFEKKYPALLWRRIISFLLASVTLVLLFPFLLVVCLIIRRESPGPVFFTQPRVGMGGKTFKVIKFRTMAHNAENIQVEIHPGEQDPRVTKAGRFLRKYRIDEIPQLINIIKGDINIIGPRPLIVYHVKEYGKNIPYFGLRQTIKPGITGWAQVMFHHSDTIEEFETKMEYDLYYLKNMSIKLDLLILMKTTKIVLLGRGAK